MKKIRVIIADDHPVFRDGLCNALKDHPSIHSIGQASAGTEVLQLLQNGDYDVVLMDIRMKGMNGLECTEAIRTRHPSVKVIALSMLEEERYMIEMFNSGASGYLIKNADKKEIVEAIERVANGETYFSVKVATKLKVAPDGKHFSSNNHEEKLREIIYLMCLEKTSKQIAEILYLSARTVEDYRGEIANLTGSRNIAGVVRYAMKNGIDIDELLKARLQKRMDKLNDGSMKS